MKDSYLKILDCILYTKVAKLAAVSSIVYEIYYYTCILVFRSLHFQNILISI